MFIKPEDTTKLPGSLIINYNQTQFRIFFTDDTIICYTYKCTGHTAQTCKKNMSNNIENSITSFNLTDNDNEKTDEIIPIIPSNSLDAIECQPLQVPITPMDWNNSISDQPLEHPLQSVQEIDTVFTSTHLPENLNNITSQSVTTLEKISLKNLPDNQIKRAISDSSSQSSPPTALLPINDPPKTQPEKKKPTLRSRSNSSTRIDEENFEDTLKPAEICFQTINPFHMPSLNS